jgi:chromate transporter
LVCCYYCFFTSFPRTPAAFCIIFPPSLIFFGLGYLYFSMGSFRSVEAMLQGAGAVACGMMASMFVEAAEESLHNFMDILIFAITFLLVRVAHVHVPYAILIVAPIAIWWYRPRA